MHAPSRKKHSEPSNPPSVLSDARTDSDSSPEKFIKASEMLPDEMYRTAQSRNTRYRCKYAGKDEKKNKIIILTYYPSLNEWREVPVPPDYKLTKIEENKETSSMATKLKTKTKTKLPSKPTTPEAEPTNAPQARSDKGLTVYEAWGKAFEAHATAKNAPQLIVKFMEKQFPGRKTMWAKWVNGVRARYNSGKLPGVSAPEEKIAKYK